MNLPLPAPAAATLAQRPPHLPLHIYPRQFHHVLAVLEATTDLSPEIPRVEPPAELPHLADMNGLVSEQRHAARRIGAKRARLHDDKRREGDGAHAQHNGQPAKRPALNHPHPPQVILRYKLREHADSLVIELHGPSLNRMFRARARAPSQISATLPLRVPDPISSELDKSGLPRSETPPPIPASSRTFGLPPACRGSAPRRQPPHS